MGNNPLRFNDPSGHVPLPLITAVVGGVAGVVGSTVGQLVANGGFENFSISDVAIADGVGFIAGAQARAGNCVNPGQVAAFAVGG